MRIAPLLVVSCLVSALGCSDNNPSTPHDARVVDLVGHDAGGKDLTRDHQQSEAGRDMSDADRGLPPDQTLPPDQAPKDLGPPADQGGPAGARIVTFNLHCLQDQPAIRAEGIAQGSSR